VSNCKLGVGHYFIRKVIGDIFLVVPLTSVIFISAKVSISPEFEFFSISNPSLLIFPSEHFTSLVEFLSEYKNVNEATLKKSPSN
jgi:hypothetical protein